MTLNRREQSSELEIPKCNEKKLEDFEKVSTSMGPEMWEDHSGCSGIKGSPPRLAL